MLYVLPETTGDIMVLQATDELTAEDYKTTFLPLFEHVSQAHPEPRLLLFLDPHFKGWQPGAMWEDARFGLAHGDQLYRCAIVGGPDWLEWASRLASHFTRGELKHFSASQLLQAMHWLNDEDEEENTPYPFGDQT
ncbi:STAS/SEC14 domain-containing protein [Pontibacter sp. JAM-7]|uniref:STAS/SEC14 domain-containing protein n=1 Tax=Pontibacter sp. JAM-7 TaxID=3366581 RepID=UPI003AF4C2E1